ncbi:hypothetical protein CPB85DRAFT_1376806 [Mucidula mucida]|nr:hypothetical protein CPB85DRAFT_1376806 [Mucidula mucida]
MAKKEAAVERHDNALCVGWNDDINTLLVYAGLFSAAVTAFTIESSQRLERDPVDAAIVILLHISRQLAEPNVTAASLPDVFVPDSDRRINVLWFLSLIVSLMTALLGILCKQWLREYQKDVAMSSKHSIALRQLRFDAFNYWRVEDVISSLPLLLQVTVLLFVLGVLDFLWHRDHVTAWIVTVAAVLAIGAVLLTTFLPAIVFLVNQARHLPSIRSIPGCALKSPQALLCLRVALLIKGFPRSYVMKSLIRI